MKKLIRKPILLASILFIIYLLCMVFGIIVIVSFPLYHRQKNFFLSRAETIAQACLDGTEDTLKYLSNSSMRILILDTEGNCLQNVVPLTPEPGTESVSVEKYASIVLDGEKIYCPAFIRETPYKLNILVVAGAPVMDGDSVAGAVLLVKSLVGLSGAIIGYSVFFTIFYWLSAVLVILNLHQKRKLEELRQNYIGNVTHTFKTPVASIKALAETLCDGVEPDPNKQILYHGMILQEANRLNHMVRDILDLSKLQSNGMDFTKTGVQTAVIFNQVMEKYSILCDYMGISLHISDELSELPLLYTNAACIKQLMEILMDNALKFVNEGENIWVEAAASKNQATICVRDNGIGISKEALPHVFERFYKCGNDFDVSGSGLGLAIAEEIVAGLKEKIRVESELGKGTAFFFTVHFKNKKSQRHCPRLH